MNRAISADEKSNKESDNELTKGTNKYLYVVNYPKFEENLCKMEMKCLFNKVPDGKYFFSNHYVDPSRSPFIKQCMSVTYTGSSLDDITSKIVADNLYYDKFKVCYIKLDEGDVPYDQRLDAVREIGFNIKGEAELHAPQVLLGITKVQDKWMFGEYEKNNCNLPSHDKKPYSYCNALSVRVSRAIVNIAVANDLNCKVIDPCCGIGTVLIEALSMGIDIKGYEINPFIGRNAKSNLEYFNYEDVVTIGDMHTINDEYDVAIIDIPYGLFSLTSIKEQTDIMKTARRIARKMVIVTFEDMEEHLVSAGFTIVDRCDVCKGKFKRHVTICQ